MKNHLMLSMVVVALVIQSSVKVFSQDVEKIPLYINLNDARGEKVFDIADHTLGLEYYDSYGKWKDVSLKIYDWKRNVVATLVVDKAYGLNTYVVDLESIFGGWEMNQIYMIELVDEGSKKYELPIRIVPPPDKPGPEVSILVSPEQIGCKDMTFNLVRFYGDIRGGQPPYIVNWFVLNEGKSEFLYQPKKDVIASEGKTSMIAVDAPPSYYVVLYVKDACGKVEKKIVNLACEDGRKKVHTIFLEELYSPLLNGKL